MRGTLSRFVNRRIWNRDIQIPYPFSEQLPRGRITLLENFIYSLDPREIRKIVRKIPSDPPPIVIRSPHRGDFGIQFHPTWVKIVQGTAVPIAVWIFLIAFITSLAWWSSHDADKHGKEFRSFVCFHFAVMLGLASSGYSWFLRSHPVGFAIGTLHMAFAILEGMRLWCAMIDAEGTTETALIPTHPQIAQDVPPISEGETQELVKKIQTATEKSKFEVQKAT